VLLIVNQRLERNDLIETHGHNTSWPHLLENLLSPLLDWPTPKIQETGRRISIPLQSTAPSSQRPLVHCIASAQGLIKKTLRLRLHQVAPQHEIFETFRMSYTIWGLSFLPAHVRHNGGQSASRNLVLQRAWVLEDKHADSLQEGHLFSYNGLGQIPTDCGPQA
jgi:hypothetical protein